MVGWGGEKATCKRAGAKGSVSRRDISEYSVKISVDCLSDSLYKQTGRNPFSGNVCYPVENHDMDPLL